MCFPDGRLPSPRWRPVVAAMVAVGAALALVSALWPVEYADDELRVPHPLDVGGADGARRVVRRRPGRLSARSSSPGWRVSSCASGSARGDEARQLRWFVYAVVHRRRGHGRSASSSSARRLRCPGGPRWPLAAGVRHRQVPALRHRPGDQQDPRRRGDGGLIAAGYVAVVVGVGGRRRLRRPARRAVAGGHGDRRGRLRAGATPGPALGRPPRLRRPTTPYEALARLSAQLTRGVRRTTCSPAWRRPSPTGSARPR